MTSLVRDSLKKLLKEEQPVPEQKNEKQPSQERTYKKYTEQDKESLFNLVHKKGMSTRAAALQLGINPRTAQSWIKNEQDAGDQHLYNQSQERATATTTTGYASNNRFSETSEPVPQTDETGTYKKYTPQDREKLFNLIREKGMSTRSAALQLGINPSTAQTWVKKEQDEQDARVYRQTQERASESPSSLSSSGSPQIDAEPSPEQHSPMNSTQTYKKYTPQDKEKLFNLIHEKGMSTRSAALQLGINPNTAQTWVKKEQDAQDARLYQQTEERAAGPSSSHTTGYASESEDDDDEPESPIAPQKNTEQHSPMNTTRTYKQYTPEDKEKLFYLIREKGMNTSVAATQLGINTSTAQSWVKKEKDHAKETGQTSKLLEKQLGREEPVNKSMPSVNTSDAGQLDDRRSATPQVVPNGVEPTTTDTAKQTRTYKKYTPQDKESLFHLVNDKGMSTRDAAIQLGINPSTAQSWVTKDRQNPQPVPVQTRHVEQSPVSTDQHVPEKESYEQSVPDQAAEPVKAMRTYRKYTPQEKEKLFHLVKEKGMSTRGAAIQLGINPSTAQSWVKKDRDENLAVLSKEQEDFLTTKISEQGVLTLDEMLESLNIEFKGLDISKTALCHFAMNKYAICFTLKT